MPRALRRSLGIVLLMLLSLLVAACTSAGSKAPASSSRVVTSVVTTPTQASTSSATPSSTPTKERRRHSTSPAATPTTTPTPRADGPVIVIDPGHSPAVHAIDPATGLDVSEYENEPEMTDVFAVAEIVRRKLEAAGYRVIFTKPTLRTPMNLAARAQVANAAHAALALSIHDQAGANGGIGFDAGNNTVYYQSVGDYRETPSGKKVSFTDAHVAALSKRYAAIFDAKRSAAQGTSIDLRGNVGYNLGSRGLAPGNIWLVQLLSRVPWIYNEAGGNSSGTVGLNASDKRRYADGLVAAVEACVPITR